MVSGNGVAHMQDSIEIYLSYSLTLVRISNLLISKDPLHGLALEGFFGICLVSDIVGFIHDFGQMLSGICNI